MDDLAFLNQLFTRIAVLYINQLVESLCISQVIDRLSLAYKTSQIVSGVLSDANKPTLFGVVKEESGSYAASDAKVEARR